MRKIFILFTLLIIVYSCHNNKTSDSQAVNTGIGKLPPFYKNQYDSLIKVIPAEERNLLDLMYSIMPLEDKLDYSPVFHYKNMLATLKAKNELLWGDSIPKSIFTFFVLPLRINNENLDTGRIFFYNELKDRIKNMTMLDAAMEINHYCHEHMTYRSSDGRTSSPLTSYRNGYGRCGEESVFVVSVLRALGIPARQVYTPRWAHTDDNHAWVEFWANGKWYYYGATEPAPQPNMGWFTEPARRAMLVGTRINGYYTGNERINYRTSSYTVINTTPVYASTKTVYVKVTDKNGKPVNKAAVDFQVYNYGEFYTLGPKKTDSNGIASFLTGYGDLLVWASHGNSFNFAELDVRKTDTLKIQLLKNTGYTDIVDFDYNPPVKPIPLEVSEKGKELNDRRLKYEDSLRKAYELTFPDSVKIQEIADRNSLDFEKLYPVIKNSRGNWKEIIKFIDNAPDNRKNNALTLLTLISEKDLHDVTAAILSDHLLNTPPYDSTKCDLSENQWNKYVFNPRVEYEMLLPYRAFLLDFFKTRNLNTPLEIFSYMKDSLKLDSTNYSHVPISARGVFSSKLTDGVSRDLVFIESCRAIGVPARLQTGSLIPEYYHNGQWTRADFYQKKEKAKQKQGFLHLIYPENADLKYFKHFTIARMKNGRFYTLEYDWDKPIKDFPEKIKLDTGYYRITTGNRQSDGSVLSQLIFFGIDTGKTTDVEIKLRTKAFEEKVVAHINPESKLLTTDKKACTIVGPHYVIAVWINPDLEPSKHVIQDINKYKQDFEKAGSPILIITEKPATNLDPAYFSDIPSTAKFVTDKDFAILKTLNAPTNTQLQNHLPVVAFIKSNGDVIFLKSGYTIGIGQELMELTK